MVKAFKYNCLKTQIKKVENQNKRSPKICSNAKTRIHFFKMFCEYTKINFETMSSRPNISDDT